MARIQQCWACGKALPQRTKANLVCHWSGLCRQCVDSPEVDNGEDTAYTACPSKRDAAHACKECGKRLPRVKKGDLTTQKQITAFAARAIGYCRYCYRAKFAPPTRRVRLAPLRWRQGGRWVDLRPLMSWWREDEANKFARAGERNEIKESRQLLEEETTD